MSASAVTTWLKPRWKPPVWDAEARIRIFRSGNYWRCAEEISCGVSIGIKESLEVLVYAVKKEIDAGYQRIKIKIKPGKDHRTGSPAAQEFPGN